MSKIDKMRKIVSEHQHAKIEGVIVDASTAQAILLVYDSLKPENQAKFASLDVRVMGNVAWKLINKEK